MGADQPLPANRAHTAGDRTNGPQALIAYWKPRDVDKGGAAKTTIGGEEGREKALSDPAEGRNQGGNEYAVLLYILDLGRPSWVPATAEDEPPSSDRCYGGSTRTNPIQYSGVAYRVQSPRGFTQLRAALSRALPGVPALLRRLDDSIGGSNRRNAPDVVPREAKYVSQGSFAAVNDILRCSHNHHNGTFWTTWLGSLPAARGRISSAYDSKPKWPFKVTYFAPEQKD